MNYTQEELNKLHLVEIEILREVIRICEINGFKYFTVGGTTLGAIRHDGFIPWDDDIDVGLVREDYEKFLKIAPSQLSDSYLLQHYSTEKKTPTYHAKVMKKGTKFVEDYAAGIDIEHGVFIDIMPFDYIPNDMQELRRYRNQVKLYHQLFIAKSTCKTSLARGKKKILYTVYRTLLHIILLPVSKEYLYNKLQSVITKYDDKKSEKLSSRGLPCFECLESDVFPTQPHSFETIMVQIPGRYHSILKKQYGDYMTLPDEKDRIGHAPKILKI